MFPKPSNLSLEFLNGLYQGFFSSLNKRTGQGIFFWDTGTMYIGEWKNDQIDGLGLLLLCEGSLFYGHFCKNQIEGSGMYRGSQGDVALANWHQDEEIGVSYYYKAREKIAKIKNEEGLIFEKKVENEQEFAKFVDRKLMNLDEILDEICSNANIYKEKLIYQIKLSHKLKYIGSVKNGEAQGLGCFFEGKKLFCLGNFQQGLMEKIGRVYRKNEIYDGQFIKGNLSGIGVYQNLKDDVYMYGFFENNLCKELMKSGIGNPEEITKNYKACNHKHNKNVEEISFEIRVFDVLQSFLGKWSPDFHLNQNILSKEEKLRPEIKGFSSRVYETSNKPQNLYYSNYFERKESKKPEKIQVKTMNNKSIYEEAEEELKDFPKNGQCFSTFSQIPIKFNEIDYESTKNHLEKTSQISQSNKLEQIQSNTNDSICKSARKLPIETTVSLIKSTVKTTFKKKTYKKREDSLKNVNNEKKIINFSSEESEINQMQLKGNITKKTSEKAKESLLTSVLHKSNLKRSTIKIIPKNEENSKFNTNNKSKESLNEKKNNKAKTQYIQTNNNLSSPYQIKSFLTISDKDLEAKNINDTSSFYLLQKIQEETSTEKDNKIVANLLGEAMHQNENFMKLSQIIDKKSISYIVKKESSLTINEEENQIVTKEMLDQNFPLNESESLSDYNIEGENQIPEISQSQRVSMIIGSANILPIENNEKPLMKKSKTENCNAVYADEKIKVNKNKSETDIVVDNKENNEDIITYLNNKLAFK